MRTRWKGRIAATAIMVWIGLLPANGDLVGHWTFDEGSGTNIVDSSAQGNHGTVVNARMHKNGVMHGELTTSNFILYKNKVYVIDFGLSQKTIKSEDHAVDLRLIKEILISAHAKIMESAWKKLPVWLQICSWFNKLC